jgi:hypothetical protein
MPSLAGQKEEEKFTLFSNHNGSLPRQQPGAMTIGQSPRLAGHVNIAGDDLPLLMSSELASWNNKQHAYIMGLFIVCN